MKERIYSILSELMASIEDEKDLVYDAQEIWQQLFDKGFQENEIEATLDHIEETSLQAPGPFWSDEIPVYRTFMGDETQRLSSQARGYLWSLKSRGVIDHAIEDEIVQKALHLEEIAGVSEIKTVAALTLFGHECRSEEKPLHWNESHYPLN